MMQDTLNTMSSSNRQDMLNLPINTDVMFANHKNIYKPAVKKRQRKLLQKISFIKPFLHENETILCVTTGCSPAPVIEQFLTGWIIFYLKRSLFIFTNERIFHVPTKHNFAYRNSIAQILYSDCENIALRGHTLVVKYKSGKKEKFYYIARNERKKIKNLLQQTPLEGQPGPTAERIHLCPRCTNTLIKDQYICPTCALQFKDKERARKISIIYPGGGYFYTGHHFLGIGDAITEVYLTLLLILVLLATISNVAAGLPSLIFIGAIFALEKILTVYHSNHFIKEYIPKDRDVEVITTIPDGQHPQQAAPEPKPEEILSAGWRSF